MKERNKQIDEIIRSKLNDYVSASSESLWDRIDAQRSEKEEDPVAFIWWHWALLGLFVISMSAGITIYKSGFFNENNTTLPENNSSLDIATEHTVQEKESTKVSTNKSHRAAESTQNNENVLLRLEDVKPPSNGTNLEQSSVVANTSFTLREAEVNKLKQTRSVLSSDQTKIAIIPNAVASSTLIESSVVSNTLHPDSKAASSSQTEINSASAAAISINHLKAIYLSSSSFLLTEIEREVDEELLTALPRGCYSFPGGAFKYDFYVDVVASAEVVSRSLEAKDSEFAEYAENRDASEKSLYAFSTGVRLSFVTEKGFALRSGLIYNQLVERFDYKNGSTEEWITTYNYDINGMVIDSTRTLRSGTRVKRTYNRYRSFDIPVILGYELHTKNVVFNINGGAYFNIWSKQKGEFLANSATPIPVKFNSKDPTAVQAFHDRLGVSLYGSIGVNYKLNDTFQLLFEPNIRTQLHSITLDNYPVEQKYINFGLMTGLRLQF